MIPLPTPLPRIACGPTVGQVAQGPEHLWAVEAFAFGVINL